MSRGERFSVKFERIFGNSYCGLLIHNKCLKLYLFTVIALNCNGRDIFPTELSYHLDHRLRLEIIRWNYSAEILEAALFREFRGRRCVTQLRDLRREKKHQIHPKTLELLENYIFLQRQNYLCVVYVFSREFHGNVSSFLKLERFSSGLFSNEILGSEKKLD